MAAMAKMPEKILLVYPPIPTDTYWSFSHALGLIGKQCAMPPLGLLTVAGLLPADIALRLVDMNFQPLSDEDIDWADMVFVSAMLIQKDGLHRIAAQCRQRNTPVVAGGPYPSTEPETMTDVNHILCGEVETLLESFLADVATGCARRIYGPVMPPDIAAAPRPRFDLLDLEAYGSMAVQYSRGCPFRCEFCDIWQRFGNRPRLKSADQMIAELDALYRLGWRGPVFVVDDNFIGNRRRVRQEFLPALTRWQQRHGNPFRFYTEASIDLAGDDDLMAAMVAAGFHEIFVGIETPSPQALAETGKHQNLKNDLNTAVRRLQTAGLEVMGGFIVGFDSDGPDIFDRQRAFIQSNAIPQAMVGLLTALPGTCLFQRLQQEGRLRTTATGNNTHTMGTNFLPRMGTAPLTAGYRRLLRAPYGGNLKSYFQRCNALLDRLGPRRLGDRVVGREEIAILLRALLRQPFSAYGWQYLKFMARNLVCHADQFTLAVKYGIVGHHFHRITRNLLQVDRAVALLDRITDYLQEQLPRCRASSGEAESARMVVNAWHWSQSALADAYRRIERLPGDFRRDLLAQYDRVAEQVWSQFRPFAGDLYRRGIRLQ
jgi:radical SAM superfamily enzyme YgiQ (UPF0313 family)